MVMDLIYILKIKIHNYKLARKKEIETVKIGSRQLYNVNKYLQSKKIKNINQIRRKIIYCRVSSSKQKRRFK
jgi:hypothetical protein